MLMMNLEEGDVPPAKVVDPTGTGGETPKKTLNYVVQVYPKWEAEEVKKSMESLSRQYKDANRKKGSRVRM